MTDAPTAKELVEKTYVYMTSISRECRKALTERFTQGHKGIPFDAVEPTLRKEIESWFASRDKNVTISHEKSGTGKPGEILMTYSGATKDAHFKLHVDGMFTLAGDGTKALCYLKNMNVLVDKRDFTR